MNLDDLDDEPRLFTWAAQGLYAHLTSLRDPGRIARAQIDAATADNRTSTTRAIRELSDAGRMRQIQGCDPLTKRAGSFYQFAPFGSPMPPPPVGMVPKGQPEPNGPDGAWVGEWPLPSGAPYPIYGTPVVYLLWADTASRNADDTPLYVGSTGGFVKRMKRHARAGKPFHAWEARPCDNRQHAFDVETELIDELCPPLNGGGDGA